MHKRLKRKLYIYLAIFFAMLIVSLYDILMGYINALQAAGGWAFGMIIGYAAGRMSKIMWHEELEQVIAKRDTTGIIILIVYMSFSLSRNWILAHWITGNMLTALAFCIVTGSRFGRIVSIRKNIKKILREQGII
ncbi:hypothetical protein [Polluticoccus soli]|uniref:hypothetical protein n=1 Tax=Polluticoccus soli TaxID=3034150 RepID=UPI0023E0B504|nr:hypothetical protein [Flavipsychrobacter sp. JY13-12]